MILRSWTSRGNRANWTKQGTASAVIWKCVGHHQPCLHGSESLVNAERFNSAFIACRKRQQAAAAAEAEHMVQGLETNIEEGDRFQLPGEGEEEGGPPDLPATLRRIREVARVLDNFKALREPKRSRADYLDQVPMILLTSHHPRQIHGDRVARHSTHA